MALTKGVRLLSRRVGIVMALILIVVAIIMALTTSGAKDKRNPDLNAKGGRSYPAEASDNCWVYLHMNKSGGSTIKSMLSQWKGIRSRSRLLVDGGTFLDFARTGRLKRFGHSSILTFGGYVESLRASGLVGDNCKWFTVFRHPVSRLVSAYFYCKYLERAPLCAPKEIDMDTVDLVTFAEHWGNFGLRQFALALVPARDIISSPPAKSCKKCPGWYKAKLHFDSLGQQSYNSTEAGLSRTRKVDSALEQYLLPAFDILDANYAAVGLLEDVPATLSLFNEALGMPGLDWKAQFATKGSQNVNPLSADAQYERDEALRNAWVDPDIQRILWLDLALYEHATMVNAKQLAHYDLKEVASVGPP